MELKGKKVLVTGGAGFVGSNITSILLERGAQVTVLDMINPKPKLKDRKRTSEGARTPNSRSPLGSAEPDSSSFRPKIESVRM